MSGELNKDSLAEFLESHKPIPVHASFSEGEIFGLWRIRAFLGRGGSGDVYRVEHIRTGQIAALKVHVPHQGTSASSRAVAKKRFLREVSFLSENKFPFFPHYFDAGESHGVSYLVIELLEARPLPHRDHEVAAFMLNVCVAVRALHRHGFVHRDIKPQNILWRKDGNPVLIDLGLLKESRPLATPAEISVTIVDGRAVGAGTPHYAAPEQFNGGVVSAATDIHALGVLIDECFSGRSPRAWDRIVRRSTSSLPEHRYANVNALMRAIRFRHLGRWLWLGLFVVVGIVFLVWRDMPQMSSAEAFSRDESNAVNVSNRPLQSSVSGTVSENFITEFEALCENIITNVPRRKLLRVETETNTVTDSILPKSIIYQVTTNEIAATLIRLNGRKHTITKPIALAANREWWIVGPGTLDATVEGMSPETYVVLDNCVLLNRTTKSPREARIRYVFRPGSYLNFVNQLPDDELDNDEVLVQRQELDKYIEDFDGAFNDIRFGGPRTLQGIMRKRERESWADLQRDL